MSLRLTLVLGLVAALAAEASAATATFRLYKARRTFVPDKGRPNPFQKSDVLAVDFLTAGFVRPDGSDIKVFAGDGARAADFKLLALGPGDRARIAVRMVAGVNEYHVCYGGPPSAPSRWEPEAGLLLETRRYIGGDVVNALLMRKTIEASGPSYATWFVPNVFQGFNLFGPSDDYVSIYRGWLDVPKAGQYRFATTSDDASYFYVDGRLVSAKPSWGRGPPDARFAGQPVQLTAGAHRVEYFHVQGKDTRFAVAAWEPPGGKFEVIPPSAFPGVFTARQTALELTGAAVPIDLAFTHEGEVLYESHRLCRLKFRDATPDGQSKLYSPQWFFGDGTSSEEREPEHVYFLPGEYTVTFALSRGTQTARIRQKIAVGADWENQDRTASDTAAQYCRQAQNYDFAAMDSRPLEAALAFFLEMGRDAEIMKSAGALLTRDDDVARRKRYDCAVLVGDRLRDLKHQPDDALTVFRAALGKETNDANKARLIRRIGDTLLYSLRKPDEALAEYRRILDRFGKLEDNVVRLAQLRVGDVYKAKGDYDRAVEAYRKAEGMLGHERPHSVENVRLGMFAQTIEDYIARKELAEAQNQLDVWGWEEPMARIQGHWSLVASRLALAKGEKGSALSEALDCANANRTGPFADALLLLAGRIQLQTGRGADAVQLARRVQKEYPESARQDEAVLLECEALHQNKEHHEAAKKALEAYARDTAGESAPKLLIVAANASLALDDKERAVKLLQLVVKDHSRSDAAKEAAAKLAALGVK